jgi:predicted dienelactone hydrolase
MRERPNRMVSKTIVPSGTVGSNPTPSAMNRFGALLVLAGVSFGAIACGDDGAGSGPAPDDTGGEVAAARPYDTAVVEETFVDRARGRTLVTKIHYPTNAPGPVPLIAFSHGSDGHPRKFTQLLTAWAEAGYVVAAPVFPLTNDLAPGPSVVTDVANQPADVEFVIDGVLALNDDPDNPVVGLIDPERIGVGGLSLGGWTTYGIAFNSCCRDDRVDAAMVMSAIFGGFEDGSYDVSGVPLMILYGTADPIAAGSPDVYLRAEPPKYLVTIIGGTHAAPFEDDPAPADATVRAVTTDFWDLYLTDRSAALDDLIADAQVPGLTEFEFDAGKSR